MALSIHRRNRVGNCANCPERWPCATVRLEEANALTARMASLLDRMAFAVMLAPALVPDTKRDPQCLVTQREAMLPSSLKLSEEAKALVDEYRSLQP